MPSLTTKLRTLEIDSTSNAALKAGETVVDAYSRTKYTSVVLIPERGCLPYFVIPEGFWALVTSFGEYKGIWEAGFHPALPWQQISHLVSKAYTVYDVPVKECPTRDNVMVEIDVSLVFHIKQTDEDVKNFVYKLAPERLDVQLKAFQEEAVRTLARQKLYSDIYDLMETEELELPKHVNEMQNKMEQEPVAGELQPEAIHQPGTPLMANISFPGQAGEVEMSQFQPAQPYVQPNVYVAQVAQPPVVAQNSDADVAKHLEKAKRTINEQMAAYGVEVYSITITNVQLPDNFTRQMEEATTFDSRNKKQAALQKYQLKVIEDDEVREQAEQRLREQLEEVKIQNEQRVADEKKLTNIYIAETRALLADINEKMVSDLREINANNELKVSSLIKDKEVLFATVMAESRAEEQKILFETDAYLKTKKAEAGVRVAELNAKATEVLAAAEKVASTGMVSKRDYDEKKQHIEALKKLGNNKNLVLTGTNKDNPLAQMIGATESRLALSANFQ